MHISKKSHLSQSVFPTGEAGNPVLRHSSLASNISSTCSRNLSSPSEETVRALDPLGPTAAYEDAIDAIFPMSVFASPRAVLLSFLPMIATVLF